MPKTLTEKQQAFLNALPETKGNIRQAMKAAGYSDNTAPSEVVSMLSEEIMKIANDLLAMNSVKAASALVENLDTPTRSGAQNALAAAKELLDRVGVVKKETQEKVLKADTIYILPAKEPVALPKESV